MEGGVHQPEGAVAQVTLPPPFVLVRALGEGGEGAAWLAHDPRLARLVVLKRLPLAQYANGADWLKLAVSADLPQVPTVYDSLQYKDVRWLVIEYVKGVPLHDLRATDGAIGLASWYAIAVDLAVALTALHQAGVVHGDIAPGNVVIDHSGHARFIDFGQMAKVGERTMNAVVPGYRAPETMGGGVLSEATDCYGFGALLHWGLSGSAPELIEQGDGRYQVCNAAPVGPVATLAATLWQCIAMLTAANPEQRASARVVLQRLREARYDLPEGLDGARQALAHYVSLQAEEDVFLPLSADGEHLRDNAHSRDPRSHSGAAYHRPAVFAGAIARLRALLFLRPHYSAMAIMATLLMLIFVVFAGQKIQSPTLEVTVEVIAITPNTPMPSQLNREWLIQQLTLGFNESAKAGDTQFLDLSLSCQTTYCQLLGRHRRGLDVHWHQVSMVATESAGVWSGLLRDFSRRVAAD